MPVISAIFLLLSLTLAVLFGTQTDAWTWGPAMVALIPALVAGLVVLLKQPSRMLNPAMLIMGGLCVAWFAIRTLQSPVEALGQADLMLLSGTLGAFISVLAIQQCRRAQWVLTGGIATLLAANLVVILVQKINPGWRPLLINSLDHEIVSGFFTHYNYAANYLLVSSLWLLGEAWNSRQRVLKFGLGLLGALGIAAIWWTGSRGGLLAAIVALGCFGAVILVEAKRGKAKWFPVAAVAIPFVALVLLGLLFSGWQEIQESRGQDAEGGVKVLLDNSVRLNYIGLAVSCLTTHLIAGGGSQSFSWECFREWDERVLGWHGTKPEFVHNEWLQAATDYGLVGFGLLIGLISVVVISAVLRLCFEPKANSPDKRTTALRLGGMAALMGMLVHANFSFVFHLLPGAMLLGMGLAATCQWQNPVPAGKATAQGQRAAFAVFALAMLVLLAPLAWKGTRVMLAMWSSHYSKHRDAHAPDQLVDLDRAIEIWPQASLLMKRGLMHHELALATEDTDVKSSLMKSALADYTSAAKHHPHLPDAAINRANVLSRLGRNEMAEEAYLKAIELQGGMDSAYRSHNHYANHLYGLGRDALDEQNFETALVHLQKAAEQIDRALFRDAQTRAREIAIHEWLGIAYANNGMSEQALASYGHAATIHYGSGRHAFLRSAIVQAALAREKQKQREPAQALALFLEARQSVRKAGGRLPENLSAEQRDAFVRALDERIKRLREIGIEAP